MIPLYHYQHKHPHNFVFLGLFTLCLSFSIGVACANTQGLSFFSNSLICFSSRYLVICFFLVLTTIYLIIAGKIVLEALVLTAGVVVSLTAYAFWASKKGKEFGYLGPILSSALTILVLTSFLQVMPIRKCCFVTRRANPLLATINLYLALCGILRCRFSSHWDPCRWACSVG
jgi:protein lifeguard